jgi:DNA transposition AAA+ family ATPase
MSDFPFPMFGGGDPEEIQRQLAGFMEQAQQQQKVAFADGANQPRRQHDPAAIDDWLSARTSRRCRCVTRPAAVPLAVTLVSEARQGLS